MDISKIAREHRLQTVIDEARRGAPSDECAAFVVANAVSLEEMALQEADRKAQRLATKLQLIGRL